ncbi:MAG: CDGSH iron-sulfur domain-containing protein [Candidatus Berkelbacteria bacterium]
MANEEKIEIVEDGPYLISGLLSLDEQTVVYDENGVPEGWQKTTDYPENKHYALCRCGKSKNKPFCDGSHIDSDFDGKETANRDKFADKVEKIEGPELIVDDVSEYCIGAGFCHRDGGVWNLVEESSDKKSKETAIKECTNCPSGRLVARDAKTGKIIDENLKPEISLIEHPEKNQSGPIWVKGGIAITSADGKEYEKRTRVTLCRCGKSANKPFCDGTHLETGFNAEN